MGDGDSGWCSVRLLGRPWTDVLSRAARVWMRVRLSREASAVGRSGLGRMRVRDGSARGRRTLHSRNCDVKLLPSMTD